MAVLAAAGWLGWPRAVPPPVHHGVVLADFENATGDRLFDRSLATVLRADLSQSPYLTLLSERQIQDTLDQMGRPKDAVVAPAVAQEICVRDNADELVHGRILPAGTGYLVLLDATDCSGANIIGAERAEVDRAADAIPALDAMIARMCGKLGESAISVDRFDVPLVPARSGSLEAVCAYSEGVWLNNHGKADAAVAPLEQAVALDPQFAAAWFSLAAIENNLLEAGKADAAVTRAHALRDRLNERQRINEEVYYAKIHTGDYSAMLAALQLGTTIYPGEWSYWNDADVTPSLLKGRNDSCGAGRALKV